MHPSTAKLLSLLSRDYPDQVTAETTPLLQEIGKAFDACKFFCSQPITFQVRFPDDVVFNKSIRMNLMYLDGKPVLHVIDVGTNYSAARFLKRVDVESVLNAFVYAWVTAYVGYRHDMLTDQGSAFTGRAWNEKCFISNIALRLTGTESHNSLGQEETYHAMRRRIFNKVSSTNPALTLKLRLAYSVKL